MTSELQPTTDRSTRALVTGVALIVATVLPGFLTASLATRIRDDFSFENSALGLCVAVFYVVSAAASNPAGRLLERIGPVRGMRLAAALTAVSCLTVVLAANSTATLTAALVLAGVANGLGSPTVSALFKRLIPEARQGMAFGAQQAGAPLGSLLAGLALPLIAIPFGWRWAYAAAGLMGLVAVALAPRGVAAPAPGSRAKPPRGFTAIHGIAIAAALASAAGVGFVSFLVSYSVENDISEAAAGLLLGGVSLASAMSRIVLGSVLDRSRADALMPLALMLAVSVGGYLLLMADQPALIVVAALVAGSLGWAWPGGLNLAVVQRSPDAPAWAVGVMMTGLFAGAVAGPLLVGVLADHGHFDSAWLLCGAFALGAAATLAVTRRRERA
ncbi:MAG TPA: MFS transporter [Thermoleophilaceae bacterium]|nr:MFS transporter [Thermoleophilaceae bacterium]